MRPRLDQPPVLEGQNPIGAADRGKSVSDHEHGAAPEQAVERRLDQLLGFRVQRRSRLVEDEERRIAENGPRDSHPLTLPSR